MALSSIFLLALYGCLLWAAQVHADSVICVMNAGTIKGLVTFTKLNESFVRVTFNGTGIPEGKHGFHVHQYGDVSTGCTAAGPHFNPEMVPHGGPDSPIRHVGDLGNVVADSQGVVTYSHDDSYLSFTGSHSILGRGVVLHRDEDDLGQGNYPDSNTTGHAGPRIACCPIVYAP